MMALCYTDGGDEIALVRLCSYLLIHAASHLPLTCSKYTCTRWKEKLN